MATSKQSDAPQTPQTIEQLVAACVARKPGKTIRKRLFAEPREEVVAALSQSLRAARSRAAFTRVGAILAEIGGDAAFEVLREQAYARRRYPRIAPNALAACNHPGVEPALLDLMQRRNDQQRKGAALAFARTRLLRAITVCAEGLAQGAPHTPALLFAFRTIGNRHELALRVLMEPGNDTSARLRALTFMMSLPYGFSLRRFDLDRFLAREARSGRPAIQPQARAVLALRIAQQTLLRPADPVSDATLLRPSIAPDSTPSSQLLHPSSPEDAIPAEENGGWWARLFTVFAGKAPPDEE